jgi:cell division protein FtsL
MPMRGLPSKAPAVKPQQRQQAMAATLLRTAFKAVLFLLLTLGIVCVARVALSAMTVQAVVDAENYSTGISEARAAGRGLEVQYALAANPNRIQELASTQLGMVPASQVNYLEAAPAATTDAATQAS